MFCRRNYQTVFKFLFLELREYLSEYIGKKCPGMKACKYAIEQSKKNGGKIQYRKWDTIKKKVVRMNPL